MKFWDLKGNDHDCHLWNQQEGSTRYIWRKRQTTRAFLGFMLSTSKAMKAFVSRVVRSSLCSKETILLSTTRTNCRGEKREDELAGYHRILKRGMVG